MTITKKIKELATGEVEAKCPICGLPYKYPKDGYGGIYIPHTCGRFECEFKYQHKGGKG